MEVVEYIYSFIDILDLFRNDLLVETCVCVLNSQKIK